MSSQILISLSWLLQGPPCAKLCYWIAISESINGACEKGCTCRFLVHKQWYLPSRLRNNNFAFFFNLLSCWLTFRWCLFCLFGQIQDLIYMIDAVSTLAIVIENHNRLVTWHYISFSVNQMEYIFFCFAFTNFNFALQMLSQDDVHIFGICHLWNFLSTIFFSKISIL